MIDDVIVWLMANPLEGVAGLAVFSVLIGALLIPRVHDIAHHGHPRC